MGSTPLLFKSVVLKIIAFCQVNHVFFTCKLRQAFLFWVPNLIAILKILISQIWKTTLQIPWGNFQYVPIGRCRIPKQRNFLSHFSNFLFVPKSEATFQRCNSTLARGKWISWRASERFILLARWGKLPCHKKLGIFKFMFPLSDIIFL
jgi:hypothetical protein